MGRRRSAPRSPSKASGQQQATHAHSRPSTAGTSSNTGISACSECAAVPHTPAAPNLQQAFLDWKKTRKEERERDKSTEQLAAAARPSTARRAMSNPVRKQALRSMFLELVRSYIGAPYAKHYHTPGGSCVCEGCVQSGRQLYSEPLFVDCCALVRRAVRRMQLQLGFRLGLGNQAYQFDTLPLRVDSTVDLEPGDLIFYSGTCYTPGARRFKFDMTHVEVFVGGSTGEATIGSRERYKWVMQYDSYRFKSARWALIAHHYCKIDTWLEGVCRPLHPDFWALDASLVAAAATAATPAATAAAANGGGAVAANGGGAVAARGVSAAAAAANGGGAVAARGVSAARRAAAAAAASAFAPSPAAPEEADDNAMVRSTEELIIKVRGINVGTTVIPAATAGAKTLGAAAYFGATAGSAVAPRVGARFTCSAQDAGLDQDGEQAGDD